MPTFLTPDLALLALLCLSLAILLDALAHSVRQWWQRLARRQRGANLGLSRARR